MVGVDVDGKGQRRVDQKEIEGFSRLACVACVGSDETGRE